MDNSIPQGYNQLTQHAEDAADGAHTHGATIGLVHVTETTIRTALENLIGKPAGPGGNPPASPGLKALWNVAKANKTAKTAAARTATSNGRHLFQACINNLKTPFGNTWNSRWNVVGLTAGSLAVPDKPMTALQQLRAFYGANPSYEKADNYGTPLTAAACEAAAQAISDTDSASNQSNTDSGNAQKAYQAALDLLYTTMSYLLNELTQLLGPDDERWYAFGFDKPSDPGTPTIPENLVVTPGAAGSKMLIADWDDGRRDDSYRASVLNHETGKVIASVIVTESDATFTLPDLAQGTLVDIILTGRNNKGETQPTDPITAAVP